MQALQHIERNIEYLYFCKRKMFSTILFMKLHINLRSWIFALLILCPVFAYAQEGGKLLQAWKKLQVRLDSATVRKYDPRYIQVPEKPWRIVLRGRTSDFNMDVNSYMDVPKHLYQEELTHPIEVLPLPLNHLQLFREYHPKFQPNGLLYLAIRHIKMQYPT